MESYLQSIVGAMRSVIVTNPHGFSTLDVALKSIVLHFYKLHAAGQKVMIVGNGGSAAIAGHAAIDLSKNAGVRATAFNDASALTCLANDFGYENVFAKQVEFHGRAGDVLMAISSSGRSPSILNAVATGRQVGAMVLTFSGFDDNNPLRSLGDINFYVPSSEYGFVEIAHMILIHATIDALTKEKIR